MATTQNSTMTTKKAMTPEFADEPSVQLKQIPQSADAPVLEPEPATNDYPSSSYLPSDKLEGEPDSAI